MPQYFNSTLLALGFACLSFCFVLADDKAPDTASALDRLNVGIDQGKTPKSRADKSLNFDFETGILEDWTATGDAFAGQPIQGDKVSARRQDMRSEHQGEYWIGTFEKLGDTSTGTLTSPPFVVEGPFASFLIGGGSDNTIRVELVDMQTDKVIHRATGRSTENMRQVVVDLSSHKGKELVVRMVDEGRAGWGHLNFDCFDCIRINPDLYPNQKYNSYMMTILSKV